MEVTLLRHCGTDLDVVNNARVSFDKVSTDLNEADKSLIGFLARGMTSKDFSEFVLRVGTQGSNWTYWLNDSCKDKLIELLWKWRKTPEHWAPFANGISATFRIKAPIFVARQLDKHQVGFVKSEVSRRYIKTEPEFYRPEVWRKAADNVKQGSKEEGVDESLLHGLYTETLSDYYDDSLQLYDVMLRQGVCPEQARMVLPQSMYTEWVWTGSLYGWARLCVQRCDRSHAQRETADVADMISKECVNLWPVSWKELVHFS